MATYLIAYDLRNESGSQDYEELWEALKKFGCVRTQDSLWLCNSRMLSKAVHNHFKQFMDSDDRLWVAEITTSHYFSNARSGTNDFLKKNPPTSC